MATVGVVGLAGCSIGSSATGTLATQVTDQPGDISDFEECIVTIQGIWVKPSDGDSEDTDDGETDGDEDSDEVDEQTAEDIDESEGREYHEFDEPQEADLVQLQDGATELIDERDLDVGTYEFLQLDISSVAGQLTGGEEAAVETPGDAPLQFKKRFEIREDQTTTFTADFTPVRRGRTNRYLLQPVAKRTSVTYEDPE